jgi:hypothetical protein
LDIKVIKCATSKAKKKKDAMEIIIRSLHLIPHAQNS